jgi:class 3 adenylate cyclase
VAARLEQLTKVYDAAILVSDETRHRAGDTIRFVPGVIAPVRGKVTPFQTWVPEAAATGKP